jgi:hypothetical protein
MKTKFFSPVIAIILVLLVCSFTVKTPIEKIKIWKENQTPAFKVTKKAYNLNAKVYTPFLVFREYLKGLYIHNNPSFSIEEQHSMVKHVQGQAELYWQISVINKPLK